MPIIPLILPISRSAQKFFKPSIILSPAIPLSVQKCPCLIKKMVNVKEWDVPLPAPGVLENLVFLELKRRGYQVFIGKFENKEIDFIAEKENRKIYIQVAYLLSSGEIIEKEFSVLKLIKDNYPKYVISMDTISGSDFEGIQRINLVDFLLNPDI